MEDKRLIEALEFQADQAYTALERATNTLFLPDAEHANVLYRESMGALLKKMIEDEQGKKTIPYPARFGEEKKETDFPICYYARSEFERFILEYSVGANLSLGITKINDLSDYTCWGMPIADKQIADEEERNDKLYDTKFYLRNIQLENLVDSYKTGSWKDNRDCGLDESGREPKETPYSNIYLMLAVGSGNLRALGDCPQAREIIKRVNLIPTIRELYSVK